MLFPIQSAVCLFEGLTSRSATHTMPRRHHLLLSLLFTATSGLAAEGKHQQINPTIDPLMVAAGFLDSHPDLRYRTRGLDEYEDRNYQKAFSEFQRAAYYSDKPSQAIVGEMLWIGLGTAQDRALAYVWMGLAAERGYTSFSEKHQHYWNELDDGERKRALEEGPAIHAEYADSVAEDRLNAVLLLERKKVTGSRLGYTGNPLQISVPGVGTLDGSQYYHPKFWDPKEYRALQDSIWKKVRIGRVNIGEVEQVSNGTSGQLPPSPASVDLPDVDEQVP
jgi:uncharacterized protein